MVQSPVSPSSINSRLLEQNILGGLDLSEAFSNVPPSEGGTTGGSSSQPPGDFTNGMLLCVTEMNSRQEIDALVEALSEVGQ